MLSILSKNEKKAPIGAICAPPTPQDSSTSNSTNGNINQPRQPKDLPGLLRFAMNSTSGADPTEQHFLPMDEDRKKFLEDAITFFTMNVVEVLKEQIKKLIKADTIKEGDDVTEYLEALETILDYIDNINIANDFHKIGGLVILKPCLNSGNPAVRAGGCALIAELCQNNPYWQNIIIENEFVPILLHILNTDLNSLVGVKCLYALSAIFRDNKDCFPQVIPYSSLVEIFMKTLQKDDDRFRMKTAFLLSSLCRSQPRIKVYLTSFDIIPVLITLISEERKPSSEHILSLLLSLVEDNATALYECKFPQYNFKEILQNYISKVENKEEYREDEEYCKRLWHMIFT